MNQKIIVTYTKHVYYVAPNGRLFRINYSEVCKRCKDRAVICSNCHMCIDCDEDINGITRRNGVSKYEVIGSPNFCGED